MSKDLSTCVNEYELAFFTQAKKDIIAQMEARRHVPPPESIPIKNSESQASIPSSEPSKYLRSDVDPSIPSSEPNNKLGLEGDQEEEQHGDNHDPGNACDDLSIDPDLY